MSSIDTVPLPEKKAKKARKVHKKVKKKVVGKMKKK